MKKSVIVFFVMMAVMGAYGLAGCASPSNPAPTVTTPPATTPTVTGPGGGVTVINSDSVITAKIQAIRKQTSGYPWSLDILVQSSVAVGSLPNPTKDSVGKMITVLTDQDMSSYKVNQSIAGKVKYAGDVPQPGIILYLYDVTPLATP